MQLEAETAIKRKDPGYYTHVCTHRLTHLILNNNASENAKYTCICLFQLSIWLHSVLYNCCKLFD